MEAALVLPLFLFALVNLLSLILLFQAYASELMTIHQTGRQLSLLAYGQGEEGKQDIRLVHTRTVRSVFPIAAWPDALLVNGCVMHKWIGYDLSGEDPVTETETEPMVYVTKSGAAYHRDRACAYLNPSVRTMPFKDAITAANKNGDSYLPCGICGGKASIVYVTDGGERYHSTISCGGLKRTIDCITLNEALDMGKHPCPKCG